MQLDTRVYRVAIGIQGGSKRGHHERACADCDVRAAVQSAGAGVHPQSLSALRAAAHHRSDAPQRASACMSPAAMPRSSLVLRDKRFGKDYVERTIRRYGPKIMDEPVFRSIARLDAAAGSAGPYPPARPGGEGLHRAPGRGHAAAHPGDRRPDARSHRPAGPDGPDRGFCLPPAGHGHLRHARDSRGASRDVLHRLARRRTHPRSGADDAGRRSSRPMPATRWRRCISSSCSSCGARTPATI